MYKLQKNSFKFFFLIALSTHIMSYTNSMISFTPADVKLIEQEAAQWVDEYIAPLNPQEIQLVMNVLHFALKGVTLNLAIQDTSHIILNHALKIQGNNQKNSHAVNYAHLTDKLKEIESYTNAFQDTYASWQACSKYIHNLENSENETVSHTRVTHALKAFNEYEQEIVHSAFTSNDEEYNFLLEETRYIHLDASEVLRQSAATCRRIRKNEITMPQDTVEAYMEAHNYINTQTLESFWQATEANHRLSRFFEAFQEIKRVIGTVYYKVLSEWIEHKELSDICTVRMFDKNGIIDQEYQVELLLHASNLDYLKRR